jgi:putative NADPH-quinone reductase
MRVLVLHAHPVAESFNGALFREVCTRLAKGGHEVDACDLYAEGFDPVLTRAERLDYQDLARNTANVDAHVERLMKAEALVLSHPVWNFGMPAILKGYLDRVFLPGISFKIVEGRVKPNLQHIRKVAVVTTYGADPLRAFLAGDPPKRFAKRTLRYLVKPGAAFSYLALYDMNRVSEEKRRRFLSRAGELMDRF